MNDSFDLIIAGTGFASTFFLSAYLQKAKPNARILVLEKGHHESHSWQVQNRRVSRFPATFGLVNKNPNKSWIYTIAFGGGSNCWWACTPRMMPNDFRIKSVYNIGADWPVSYAELEEYYCQVELAMAVSGPSDGAPFPRSVPYPQPPHEFSEPDKLLKQLYPDLYFQQPTARARISTPNRSRCCAHGVCQICPVNAKFTIQTEMAHLYEDPRVKLVLGAEVKAVETRGAVATGVAYGIDGKMSAAKGELIVLGANAIFNAHILLRSGLTHPLLGKYLGEQISIFVTVDLDGVDNFQGSTSITGHGYMLYDGEHRREKAACLIESINVPSQVRLRTEHGKWRQRMRLRCIFEDLPDQRNYVAVNNDDPDLAETVYMGYSVYTQRAIDSLGDDLSRVLSPLPVESFRFEETINKTEGHITGTTVMGNDPGTSVCDRHLVHHKLRNLLLLGSGAFPTTPPANPTLTLAALSLWAASHVLA